eukprot:COSAG02_NODE_1739_length_11117_cov_14.095843_9_plen_806_part_01
MASRETFGGARHRVVDPFLRVGTASPQQPRGNDGATRRTGSALLLSGGPGGGGRGARRTTSTLNSSTPSVFDTSASRRSREQERERRASSPRESDAEGWSAQPSGASSRLGSAGTSSADARPLRTASGRSSARSPSYWERYWKIGPSDAQPAAAPASSPAPAPAPATSPARTGSALATPPRGYSTRLQTSRRPPSTVFQAGSVVEGSSATPDGRRSSPSRNQDGPQPQRWSPSDDELAAAAVSGDADKVAALMAAGVRCDVPDAHGETSLHKAVRFDNAAIVRSMCKTKPNANVQGREGRSPLHEAALYNHSQCAAELLVAGADFDLRDRFRHTAREIAIRQGHSEVVQLIDTYQRLLDQVGLEALTSRPEPTGGSGGIESPTEAPTQPSVRPVDVPAASHKDAGAFEYASRTEAVKDAKSSPPNHERVLPPRTKQKIANQPDSAVTPPSTLSQQARAAQPESAEVLTSTPALNLRVASTAPVPAATQPVQGQLSNLPHRNLPGSYVESVFHALDTEKRGYLSVDMVRHAFKELQLPFAGREIAAIPPPDLQGRTKIDLELFNFLVRNREKDVSPTPGRKHSPSDLESVYNEMYGSSPVASPVASSPIAAPAEASPGTGTTASGERISPPTSKHNLRPRSISWQDQHDDERARIKQPPKDQQTKPRQPNQQQAQQLPEQTRRVIQVQQQTDQQPQRPSLKIAIDPDAMSDAAIASALGGMQPESGTADLPIDAQSTPKRPSLKIAIDPDAMSDAAIASALGGMQPESGTADLPIDAQSTPKRPSLKIAIDPDAMSDAAIASALGGM